MIRVNDTVGRAEFSETQKRSTVIAKFKFTLASVKR